MASCALTPDGVESQLERWRRLGRSSAQPEDEPCLDAVAHALSG